MKEIKNKKTIKLLNFFDTYMYQNKNYEFDTNRRLLYVHGYKYIKIHNHEFNHHVIIDLSDEINEDENSNIVLVNYVFESEYLYINEGFLHRFNDCVFLNKTNELSLAKPGVRIYKVFTTFDDLADLFN